MDVDINTAVVAAETNQLAQIATRIERAASTAATRLSGLSGMAGIDPMAEDWVNGTVDSGGYDAIAQSAIDGGTTLAQAVAGFEGHVLAIAAGYRAMEIAGAEPGTPNTYASMSPTTIAGQCWSLGTALGDEQRGTALGEIRQWVEEVLRDTAGIVFPTADTDKVTLAQGVWEQYASDLTEAAAELRAALPATLGYEFPQRESVIAAQTRLATLISDAATDATSIAGYCETYAANVSDIRAELESMMGQLLAEIAIDLAITGVLAVLTAGIGAIAGSAKAAATIVKWAVRINNVILRLRALITSSKAAVRITSRIGIEALRSTVSGTMANAGASLIYGNFSWSNLGTAAITSSVGGGFAGPFSHIGTQSASRLTRMSTQAGVGTLTGTGGGIAGEWTASQITGSDFNLIMAAVTGGIGGAASGGAGGIANPSSGGGGPLFGIGPKPSPAGTQPTSPASTQGVSSGSVTNTVAAPTPTNAGSTTTTTVASGGPPKTDSTAPTPGAASGGSAVSTASGGSGGSSPNGSPAPTPTGGGGGVTATAATGNGGVAPAADGPQVPADLAPSDGPQAPADPGPSDGPQAPADPGPSDGPQAPADPGPGDGPQSPTDAPADSGSHPPSEGPDSTPASDAEPTADPESSTVSGPESVAPPSEGPAQAQEPSAGPSETDASGRDRLSDRPSPSDYPRPSVVQEIAVSAADGPGPRTPFAGRTDLEPDTRYTVEGRGDFYTDATGRVVHVEATYGGRGNLNADLLKPQPNTTYVVHPDVTAPVDDRSYAHVFETDSSGRTVHAHTDNLAQGNADRSESVQSRVGREGGEGYEGGHLFGNYFGGGGEDANLVAMLRDLNRGAGESFFNLENHWRQVLRDTPDASIEVSIRPRYGSDSTVPEAIEVEFSIDGGEPEWLEFRNVS